MPISQTHVYFLKKIYNSKKYKYLLDKLDINSLYLGAVFPDMYYVSFSSKNNAGLFLHEYNRGINFGYRLLNHSKNIREASFSIGFLSHFILDSYIHGYLHKENLFFSEYHIVLEIYLNSAVNKTKYIHRFKSYLIPNRLLNSVFKKYHEKEHDKFVFSRFIGKYMLWFMLFVQYNIYYFVYKKIYSSKHNFCSKVLCKIICGLEFLRYKYNVKNFINPSKRIINNHLEIMVKLYSKAQKEFIEILKKLDSEGNDN